MPVSGRDRIRVLSQRLRRRVRLWAPPAMRNATKGGEPAAHPDTVMTIETLGQLREYRPTYPFEGRFIDDFHRYLATASTSGATIDGLPVPGKLQREDALKLYECGYFAGGDLLELGTQRGLSAWILARSLLASGAGATLTKMELSGKYCAQARGNLAAEGVGSVVEVLEGDADLTCSRLAAEGRRFAFAFVDHSHAYEPVASACEHLHDLLVPGGVAVFHDYNDSRNAPRTGVVEPREEYGVFAAVEEAVEASRFERLGVYGCCAVVRKLG